MNRQSNLYTIIYSTVLVLVVGVVLSLVYQALRPAQEENIANDTKRQILAAARIIPQKGENVADIFKSHITDSFIVNNKGERVENASIAPFDVNTAEEVKKPDDQRLLPVFECKTDDGVKYIVPMAGAGLWGPIWGYIALDSNGDTVYGAYFAHQGETPGLGAEIEKPAFQNQFQGKTILSADGSFAGIAVVKAGHEPSEGSFVHAISGGTITSQGVQKMLSGSLQPYTPFFDSLKANEQQNNSEK